MNINKMMVIDEEVAESLLCTKWCSIRGMTSKKLLVNQNIKGIGVLVWILFCLAVIIVLDNFVLNSLLKLSSIVAFYFFAILALCAPTILRFQRTKLFLEHINDLRDQCEGPDIDHVFDHMYHEDSDVSLVDYAKDRLESSINSLIREEKVRSITNSAGRNNIILFYELLLQFGLLDPNNLSPKQLRFITISKMSAL